MANTTTLFTEPEHLFSDLATLRGSDDIRFDETLKAYVVTRYDDVVSILDRPEIFSSEPTVPVPPDFIVEKLKNTCPLRGTLLGHDNPDHDRLRQSVASFFVPRRLERFKGMMESLANELIDEFVADGEINIKSRFALPLPLKVVSAIAGLDPARWEWTGKALAFFGGHKEMSEGSFEEKLERIIELHEHVAHIIQERKQDRRDDLISHIWNERDSGRVTMTDFEHLSMIPGLLLAGHETTTNLLSMGLAHLLEHDLWQEVTTSDDHISKAIEELVRYESAITGMRRKVMCPVTFGSKRFEKGDMLFLAYNAGSRDPEHFKAPDQIILGREGKTQHLGFGKGIHACLGAPLARLLLKIEMKTLAQRLPGLKLVTPYLERKYDYVHEGRGIEQLVISWDRDRAMRAGVVPPENLRKASTQFSAPRALEVMVKHLAKATDNILEITLVPVQGMKLPSWTAGAHIDVSVGNFGFRQYSLCSNPQHRNEWRIAVLREENGRGGSAYIHSTFQPDHKLTVMGPRNHFVFRPAKKYLLIAGGIGITPILPMIEAATEIGSSFEVLYLGTALDQMAYVKEVSSYPQATIWPKAGLGRFHLDCLIENRDLTDTLIYCCGPERLVRAVEELFSPRVPSSSLIIERFVCPPVDDEDRIDEEFDVVLRKSGSVVHVPRDRSILDVVNEAGAGVLSTCGKGTCGTCEVRVLEGSPDHRDTVLTHDEKQGNKSMMICVSRCHGSQLVLDLW